MRKVFDGEMGEDGLCVDRHVSIAFEVLHLMVSPSWSKLTVYVFPFHVTVPPPDSRRSSDSMSSPSEKFVRTRDEDNSE